MLELLRRYQRVLVVLLMLALPLWSLLSQRGDASKLGPIDGLALRSTGFVQSVASQVVGGILSIWDRYVFLVDVEEENRKLREEIERLEEINTRLIGVQQENARLRKALDFKQQNQELTLIPAHVVGNEVSPYFHVMRIKLDIGEQHVEPLWTVVSYEGLVGQIESVADSYADVMLITDPRSSFSVITQEHRAIGILKGQGSEDSFTVKFADISKMDVIVEDDSVVTSSMVNRVPKELRVGRVVEVRAVDSGPYQEVLVEPAVDFNRLEEVFIIVPR